MKEKNHEHQKEYQAKLFVTRHLEQLQHMKKEQVLSN